VAEGVMTKRQFDELTGACDAQPNHTDIGDVRGEDVILALSLWLDELVRHYDALEWTITGKGLERNPVFRVSAFHGRPMVSRIEDFIRRICLCAKLEDSVVLVAAVYLSRMIEKTGGTLPISSCTVHRLVIQALGTAAKFTLDGARSNKSMAALVDMPVQKYNQLEVKFLCQMQYDMAVSPEELRVAKEVLTCSNLPWAGEVCSKRVKVGPNAPTESVESINGRAEDATNNYRQGEAEPQCGLLRLPQPETEASNNYQDLEAESPAWSQTATPFGNSSLQQAAASRIPHCAATDDRVTASSTESQLCKVPTRLTEPAPSKDGKASEDTKISYPVCMPHSDKCTYGLIIAAE